jgi:zinc/manganese transport system substrate-binding protein
MESTSNLNFNRWPRPLLLRSFVLWSACVLLAMVAQGKLKVVATTPDFAALAREIGGDRVEVTSLAKPTEDPHFVDAEPSLIIKLNQTDVLIESGTQLEIGWLLPMVHVARNPKILRGTPGNIMAIEGIEMLEVPAKPDRLMGNVHPAGNPHYMTDPVNARIVAEHISEAFARLDTSSGDYFRVNLKRFSDQLATKLDSWQRKLTPFRGRRIVAYHNTWPYFARRFGLKIDLFLEPTPSVSPAPKHLTEVIKTMKKQNIKVIFLEPYLNWRTAETVARQTGATVILVSQFPGGVQGTEAGYIALLDYLVDSVAKALGNA